MREKLRVGRGTLLASAPSMLDPNFMHTVSVMCEHTEAGAYGLVINKQSTLTIDRLLTDHPVFKSCQIPIWWGGPVGMNALQILHHIPEEIPDGMEIAGGLYLGGELEHVAEYVQRHGEDLAVRKVRFLLGYAGWGEGQLEGELVSGSWLPLPLILDLAFQNDQERTWQEAVRSLGAEGRDLAGMPPDIHWN